MWPGPCRQVCRLRFTFVWLDHVPELSDLLQGFLHPKTSNPTFVKEYDFLELFRLLTIEFYLKKRNFEDNFSVKIDVEDE